MGLWKKGIAVLLATLCTLGTSGGLASAESAADQAPREAVLVLINRLSHDDLARMPHLQALGQHGAIGLMNVNTGGGRTDGSAYATLAVGVPVKEKASNVLAYSAQETLPQPQGVPASARYQQLRGESAAEDEVLLLSMFKQLRRQNVRQWAGTLGTLGDVLHSHGYRTAVYGSSDRGQALWRPATLVTSDAQGRTDAGDVSAHLLEVDAARPYGVRTDYAQMLQAFRFRQGAKQQAPVVEVASASLTSTSPHVPMLSVFDLADLYRLESYRSRLTAARYQELRGQILQEIDAFLGRLLQEQEQKPNSLLLVTSPQVGFEAAQKSEWLAPIAMVGEGVVPHSVLTSSTTRREGIVSNLDVVPTLAEFLQVEKPAGMIGYPLSSSTKLSPDKLATVKNATLWTYTHRSLVLGVVGAVIGIGLLAALLRLLFAVGLSVLWARRLLWGSLALPLCLYLLPLWHARNLWETAGAVLASLMLFVAIPFRILSVCQSVTGRAIWLSAGTILLILFDTWQGGMLAKTSFLSYDPIFGARYYGVGNENMGVIVGAVALVYGVLLHNRKTERVAAVNLGLLLVGSLLTVFFASPELGTNTGGALTMAATTALCFALQKRLRPLLVVGTLVLAMSGALGVVFLLNQSSAAPSHIGNAAHQVLTGGFLEVVRIVTRKSEMFYRYLSSSIWSWVFLALYAGFLGYLFRSSTRTGGEQLNVRPAIVGGALGAAVGLFTNDSGLVVAGMMLMFVLLPYLLILLENLQGEVERAFAYRST